MMIAKLDRWANAGIAGSAWPAACSTGLLPSRRSKISFTKELNTFTVTQTYSNPLKLNVYLGIPECQRRLDSPYRIG